MRSYLSVVVLALLALAFAPNAHAQRSVLQRGYDAGVSGANLSEVTLNTANVAPATFGLVFTLPVDDKVYAQPLYVPGVAIPGQGTHNVVYVATMSDSLFAFDADTGAQLWYTNFADTVGATPVMIANFTFAGNTNIAGNVGILSTPVIDPSTHILYLVACTLEGGTMVYRLHAVNITNGTEPHTNVVISGNYGGVTFDPPHQTQRVSLALAANQVVFGFAAAELESDDKGGYTGWMMAYDETTLVQSGVFATSTTGTEGSGVWQSGRPPVVDGSDYVYVFTGNGYTSGYDGVSNFSETALKLNPAAGLSLVDWFTPSTWSTLDGSDLDLSSSGPMLIPGTSLLAGGGKAGVLYVLNTENLGRETATDSGVVQEETITGQLRGGPVYWQRSTANGGPLIYNWGANDWVKAYAFNGTTFATSPSSQGSGTQIYPGGILTLSANNDTPGSGVLWATVAASGNVFKDATDPGVLYAFDASNVSHELWASTMNSARDNFGNFAKFVPPLVVNGKVYVATFSNQVAVYGLLPAAASSTSVNLSAVADVVADVNSGTAATLGGWDGEGYAYNATLLGTSISYGGSTFTIGSAGTVDAVSEKTIPLPAGNYATLNLLGSAVNGNHPNQSFVVTYTDGTTTTITQSLSDWWGPPQNYSGESTVTQMASLISPTGATLGHAAYVYGYSFAINSAKTLKSLTLPASRNVAILAIDVTGSGTGTPVAATPAFTPAPGSYTSSQSVALSDTTPGAVIYYTTNGMAPTLSSATYNPSTPITVSSTETIETMAVASGYTNSAPVSGLYTINVTPPVGGSSSVNLSAVADVVADVNSGTAATLGGWDGEGYAYNATLLGTSISYGGSTFTIGSAGTVDAVSEKTIPLPAGNYATLNLLGSAVNGNHPNQSFVVTYTDGTTTTITQSLSDWWGPPQNYSGESTVTQMASLISPTGATLGHAAYVYGYSFAINSAKTLKSLTLPASRNVAILAVDVSNGAPPAGSSSSSVNLSAVADVVADVNSGTAATLGGWDGEGYAYNATLLGTSISYGGSTFTIGSAGTVDAVSEKTIPLPAGNYATLNLLGSAVNGNHPNQSFVVTYTDGTTTTITQSLSDWWGPPQNYSGESTVTQMASLISPTGATLGHAAYVYGYSFAINSAKTLKSLTLPASRNVAILAVDVVQ